MPERIKSSLHYKKVSFPGVLLATFSKALKLCMELKSDVENQAPHAGVVLMTHTDRKIVFGSNT